MLANKKLYSELKIASYLIFVVLDPVRTDALLANFSKNLKNEIF
jgi:hypothetical protein